MNTAPTTFARITGNDFPNLQLTPGMTRLLDYVNDLIEAKFTDPQINPFNQTEGENNTRSQLTTHLRGVFEFQAEAKNKLTAFMEEVLNKKEVKGLEDALNGYTGAGELASVFESSVTSENFEALNNAINNAQSNKSSNKTLPDFLKSFGEKINTAPNLNDLTTAISELNEQSLKELKQIWTEYSAMKTANLGAALGAGFDNNTLIKLSQGFQNTKFNPRPPNIIPEQEIARLNKLAEMINYGAVFLKESRAKGQKIDETRFINQLMRKLNEANLYQEDVPRIQAYIKTSLENGTTVEQRQETSKGILDAIGGGKTLLLLFLPVIAGPVGDVLAHVPIVGRHLASVLHGFVQHGSSGVMAIIASQLFGQGSEPTKEPPKAQVAQPAPQAASGEKAKSGNAA